MKNYLINWHGKLLRQKKQNNEKNQLIVKLADFYVKYIICYMAGVVGLEPTDAGVRVPCLTSLAIPQDARKVSFQQLNIIYSLLW